MEVFNGQIQRRNMGGMGKSDDGMEDMAPQIIVNSLPGSVVYMLHWGITLTSVPPVYPPLLPILPKNAPSAGDGSLGP